MYSRRDFGRFALLAGVAPSLLNAKAESKVDGVMIGAQSYSFRALPERTPAEVAKAMNDIGLTYLELWQGHLEPKGMRGPELKTWRTSQASLDAAKEAKSVFDKAGINVYAFNDSFRDDWSDEEIAQGMKMAHELGTKYITASSTLSAVPRIAKLAKEHNVIVAFHNHDNTKDPNEFAKPEAFAKAIEEGGGHIAINLDIGHFTAANYDPVQYLEEHHDKIVTLHLKDRKTNHGPNMPFGQGETKIKEVLQVLKTKKYKIPAMVEYEYKGAADPVTEVKNCYAYIKQCLA